MGFPYPKADSTEIPEGVEVKIIDDDSGHQIDVYERQKGKCVLTARK